MLQFGPQPRVGPHPGGHGVSARGAQFLHLSAEVVPLPANHFDRALGLPDERLHFFGGAETRLQLHVPFGAGRGAVHPPDIRLGEGSYYHF